MEIIDAIVDRVSAVLGLGDDEGGATRERADAPPPAGRTASRIATSFERAPRARARADAERDAPSAFSAAVHALASSSGASSPAAVTVAPAGATTSTAGQTAHRPGQWQPAGSVNSVARSVDAAPPLARANARAIVADASAASSDATPTTLGDVDSLTGTGVAAVAARNVQSGLDYFAARFGRDGLDGRGSAVSVMVEDTTSDADGTELFRGNGGYYALRDASGRVTEAVRYGQGTGTTQDERGRRVVQRSMAYADDLAVHELVHGIIRSTTGTFGGGEDEAGATNEAIADVLAASATRDWRIGEGMYGPQSEVTAMRDIAAPDAATASHGLARDMAEVRASMGPDGKVEEHWASGVISTAAHRVHQRLGADDRAWGVVEQTFYDVIEQDRMGDMSFATIAGALRGSAAARFGVGSAEFAAFDAELRRGGL